MPRSPCIGVCRIDRGSGFCVGCLRTREEIRDWKRAGKAEKRLILARLETRSVVDPGKAEKRRLRQFHGGCHCGNLTLVFETRLKRKKLRPRACRCSFCRAHGARTVTDPAGTLRIGVGDPSRCTVYRFGLRTADYLVCAGCGVYVAAVMREPDGIWATINVNALADSSKFPKKAVPVSYEAEDAASRRSRRRTAWTPVVAIGLPLPFDSSLSPALSSKAS